MHLHDVGRAEKSSHGRNVMNEIVIEPFVKCRADCVRRRGHEKRMTVGRCPRDRLRGDTTPCARPVLDDELLAEVLRQPLPHQAREHVGRAARRKADDDPHRPGRIGLRPHNSRQSRQRGSARAQIARSKDGDQLFQGMVIADST